MLLAECRKALTFVGFDRFEYEPWVRAVQAQQSAIDQVVALNHMDHTDHTDHTDQILIFANFVSGIEADRKDRDVKFAEIGADIASSFPRSSHAAKRG